MDQGLIPKRYAKALYEVAREQGNEAKLYDEMKSLDRAVASGSRLNETLENPFVSNSDKAALIYTACGSDSTDAPLANFVRLLEENHRLGMVRAIANAYQDIYRQDKHIYRVEVTAASKMEPKSEERLKKLILARLDGGTMEYTMKIDPSLIGGFTVNIENQRLDASVKNELKQLRLNLLRKH